MLTFPEEKSRWHDYGPISILLYTLAGCWISFGLHLSFSPLYIDIHILWWVVSVMSKARGVEIRGYEEAYYDDHSVDAMEATHV